MGMRPSSPHTSILDGPARLPPDSLNSPQQHFYDETVANHSPGLSYLYPAASGATTVRFAVGTLDLPTPMQVGSVSGIGDLEKQK